MVLVVLMSLSRRVWRYQRGIRIRRRTDDTMAKRKSI